MEKLLFMNESGIITRKLDMLKPIELTTHIQFTLYFPPLDILQFFLEENYADILMQSLSELELNDIRQIHIESEEINGESHRIFTFVEIPTKSLSSYVTEEHTERLLALKMVDNISIFARQNFILLDFDFIAKPKPIYQHSYKDGVLDNFCDIELQFYASTFDRNYEYFKEYMIKTLKGKIDGIEYHFELDNNGLFKLTCLSPLQAQIIVKHPKISSIEENIKIIHIGDSINLVKLNEIIKTSYSSVNTTSISMY